MSLKELMDDAREKAYARGAGDRARSAVKMKVRKWRKPRNVVKTAASAAGAAIPVPVVANVVDYLVNIAVTQVEERVAAKKLKTANTLASEVKHEIKSLNVSELDAQRYKVTERMKIYRALMTGNVAEGAPCEKAFMMLYSRYRAEARNEKLRGSATALRDIASKIVEWCDEIENALRQGDQALEETAGRLIGDNHPDGVCGPQCIYKPSPELRNSFGYQKL